MSHYSFAQKMYALKPWAKDMADRPILSLPKERTLVLEEEDIVGSSFDIIVARRLIMTQKRARDRGLEFNIDFHTMRILMKRKTCYYSGVVLTEVHQDPHQRTIERLNDKIGYVKGNVVACSYKFNLIKEMLLESTTDVRSCTVKELKKFVGKL